MKKFNSVLLIVVILVVGFLVYQSMRYKPKMAVWGQTSINCLPGGHANAMLHIHTDLKIFVDGTEEQIPANIGVNEDCMAEVHTHDTTGKIHIESTDPGKTHTLGDFFVVYGKELERPGFILEGTLGGEKFGSPGEIILKDHEEIRLDYTSSQIIEVELPEHSPLEGELEI